MDKFFGFGAPLVTALWTALLGYAVFKLFVGEFTPEAGVVAALASVMLIVNWKSINWKKP